MIWRSKLPRKDFIVANVLRGIDKSNDQRKKNHFQWAYVLYVEEESAPPVHKMVMLEAFHLAYNKLHLVI